MAQTLTRNGVNVSLRDILEMPSSKVGYLRALASYLAGRGRQEAGR